MTKKQNYIIPLSLIFCLFFMWAISSNLMPTMIKQLMKTCELNTFEASFTETAYWLAYFLFPIPIAMFLKKFSYKAGIIFGLATAATGAFLFFPAAIIRSYWAYLCVFFIIATGMCFLETAGNPYVTVLGEERTAVRRLNLAQSFNGLGAFIAGMFLSKLVLGESDYTRDTLPADYEGGWEHYVDEATANMQLPYFIIGVVLVAIAVIFLITKFPKLDDEVKTEKHNDKLMDFSVLKKPNLKWGVIAQFFYNGGQTAINSLFLVYCTNYAGLSVDDATTFFGYYMLMFLVGRWIGTALMTKLNPSAMLLVYSVVLIGLCIVISGMGGKVGLWAMLTVPFFMSIIYPTQFSMALQGLGEQTKSGSAFLVMAIVGNACLPQLTAYVMHFNPIAYHIAYLIPAICFGFCAYYGWRNIRHKTGSNQE